MVCFLRLLDRVLHALIPVAGFPAVGEGVYQTEVNLVIPGWFGSRTRRRDRPQNLAR